MAAAASLCDFSGANAAATRAHLPRDLMKEAAPVAAVSNEVAAVALVISALALGAHSPALG